MRSSSSWTSSGSGGGSSHHARRSSACSPEQVPKADMRFTETPLHGAWLIETEPIRDDRGWFARSFDREQFLSRGMDPEVVQCNISYNARAGTLRGMHYQSDPHGEPKLVRCTRGAILDVIVDL